MDNGHRAARPRDDRGIADQMGEGIFPHLIVRREIAEKGKDSVIHQYRNNGYNIVMDVNSGSVHVVDDCVYEILPEAEKLYGEGVREKQEMLAGVKNGLLEAGAVSSFGEQELSEAVDEILELAEAQQLFTEDIYEKYIGDFKNRQTVVKALCLHVAHDCNLACRYCFAEEGEYHGRRAIMSY